MKFSRYTNDNIHQSIQRRRGPTDTVTTIAIFGPDPITGLSADEIVAYADATVEALNRIFGSPHIAPADDFPTHLFGIEIPPAFDDVRALFKGVEGKEPHQRTWQQNAALARFAEYCDAEGIVLENRAAPTLADVIVQQEAIDRGIDRQRDRVAELLLRSYEAAPSARIVQPGETIQGGPFPASVPARLINKVNIRLGDDAARAAVATDAMSLD